MAVEAEGLEDWVGFLLVGVWTRNVRKGKWDEQLAMNI